MAPFYLLRLFIRGGWVVQKGKNSVYVVIECPLGEKCVENLFCQTNLRNVILAFPYFPYKVAFLDNLVFDSKT